jgi:hypothetical protein
VYFSIPGDVIDLEQLYKSSLVLGAKDYLAVICPFDLVNLVQAGSGGPGCEVCDVEYGYGDSLGDC